MKIAAISNSLILSLSMLSLTACSHVENSKNAIVIQDQSVSNIIHNLDNLDFKKSYENIDNEFQSFLKGYQNVNVGEVRKARAIFET